MAEEPGEGGGAPPAPADPPAAPDPAPSAPADPAPASSEPAEPDRSSESGEPEQAPSPSEEPPAAAEEKPADAPAAEEPKAEESEAPPPDDAKTQDEAAADKADESESEPTAENSSTGNGDTAKPGTSEFEARVRELVSTPDTNTGVIREIADNLRKTAEGAQGAADDAAKAAEDTTAEWADPAGQQLREKATEPVDATRAVGSDAARLGEQAETFAGDVDHANNQIDNEISRGQPIYDTADTLPDGERELAKQSFVEDTAGRVRDFLGATREKIKSDTGWEINGEIDQENVDTFNRWTGELGSKNTSQGERFGRQLGNRELPADSRVGNAGKTRIYEDVADASLRVDSGLRNLELAGNDVAVRSTGKGTVWASTAPSTDSLYGESATTWTDKGKKFEEMRAWGVGASYDATLDVGEASVKGTFETTLGYQAEGEFEAGPDYVNAGGEVFAGHKASLAGYGEYKGFGAGGRVERWTGVGVDAGITAGQRADGKWVLGGSLGAALGTGGKIEGHIVIDPEKAVATLKDAGTAIQEGVGSAFDTVSGGADHVSSWFH
ncbi:hypothetical protein SAMN05216266_10912 [Amycolatopsis marina]|uniref:Outer membrane channel protein CpnT-like N-terminal domain-containing protein n=1 Tax=Amycolatopsis marina TaxID=490629 RepID=A0A1I1ACS6_9PSEU|nr:hypothetical protein [Amycolatopsis marina]SFB35815.1 hypothetical protein SAMN05216266_10912 [Amycolatopsis marina]